MANFADDNTPYAIEKTIDPLLQILVRDISILTKWFGDNYFKMNPDKCHLLVCKHITLPYLINVHGRLLFSEKISREDALIRWWTLINFLAKFQGGRLFQCGRLLIFGKMQNAMQCFHTCIF